jgi:hypothetical protein
MRVILTSAEQRKLRRLVKRLKDIGRALLISVIVLGILFMYSRIQSRYNIDAEIISYEEGIYTAKDVAGYTWKFEDDRAMFVGTAIELTMFNAHTDDTRIDDTIIKVTYK